MMAAKTTTKIKAPTAEVTEFVNEFRGNVKTAAETLIDQELAVQKAVELKLDRDPQVVQALEAARRDVLARAYKERVTQGVTRAGSEEARLACQVDRLGGHPGGDAGGRQVEEDRLGGHDAEERCVGHAAPDRSGGSELEAVSPWRGEGTAEGDEQGGTGA